MSMQGIDYQKSRSISGLFSFTFQDLGERA